jgi:serine/threonine protein kinase
MPDGGIDVDDYIMAITDSTAVKSVYIELNNSLVDLLVNGIQPMNQSNLYHCDVKGSNILVQKADSTLPSLMTRLIDWGLSVYQKDHSVGAGIPDKLDRRPFQFNVPFSVILFNKKFQEKYKKFLENSKQINFYAIREFVINYIFYWNKERGAGHLKTINSIVKHLSYDELTAIDNKKVKNHIIEYEFTYYYIVEYISKILFKYTTKDRKLNLLEYFNEVFLKNIDIWGLTMIYMVFLDHVQEIFNLTNTSHEQFIQKIKYIIIHFLFETPTEAIDINKLALELQSLNKIITNFDQPNELNEKVNYFASLKKIDITDIKSIKTIGGRIYKKNKTKPKSKTITITKTIKKRRTCGKPLTKRQRL